MKKQTIRIIVWIAIFLASIIARSRLLKETDQELVLIGAVMLWQESCAIIISLFIPFSFSNKKTIDGMRKENIKDDWYVSNFILFQSALLAPIVSFLVIYLGMNFPTYSNLKNFTIIGNTVMVIFLLLYNRKGLKIVER